jgi:hypothetical protein
MTVILILWSANHPLIVGNGVMTVLQMERVYQMHVVPDLLPAIHPTLDLRVLYNEPPPKSRYLRTRTRRRQLAVQAGTHLLPEQVCSNMHTPGFSYFLEDATPARPLRDCLSCRTPLLYPHYG